MRTVHLSICSNDGMILNAVAESLKKKYPNIVHTGYESTDLDNDELAFQEMLQTVSKADFVTVSVHGDTSLFKKFDRFLEIIDNNNINCALLCTEDCVTAEYRRLFKDDDNEYRKVLSFLHLGGDENHKSLFFWLLNKEGYDVNVPEPKTPPAQGVYIKEKDYIDIESYVSALDDKIPNIGILFYQKLWTSNNLKGIDGLIEAVVASGCNPVPLFVSNKSDLETDSIGVPGILFKYFHNGKPTLDAIIETRSFSQTVIASPGSGEQVAIDDYLKRYGVPVIQSSTLVSSESVWKKDPFGFTSSEIVYSIVHPEFDGQLISVPFSSTETTENGGRFHSPLNDRCSRVAETAKMWAMLRKTPNDRKRVAILLYMYPPTPSNAGGASGLDSFESVVSLMKRMKEEGYNLGDNIPNNGKELSNLLFSSLTNNFESISDELASKLATGFITKDTYRKWFSEIDTNISKKMTNDWGKPPGCVNVVNEKMLMPGRMFGNILVGFQPDRGKGYHDVDGVMPHSYLGYYRWLKQDMKMQAIVHMGTHGTLEWLPGKGTAMDSGCCPDFILDSIPNINPYIIGNPGEAMQAKRRACAVAIGHMIPAMGRSGGYDSLNEIEAVVQEYFKAKSQNQHGKADSILNTIKEKTRECELDNDLEITFSNESAENDVDKLFDYITELKDNLIKDGLHILGKAPEGERLVETIYSMTRLSNGNIPSLRESMSEAKGYDLNEIIKNTSFIDEKTKLPFGSIINEIDEEVVSLIRKLMDLNFNSNNCIEYAKKKYGNVSNLLLSIKYVCERLVPDILNASNEIDSVIHALSGNYIEPGPSGCPTRGGAGILPTGRNMYSIDPCALPWQSSWKTGGILAEEMIKKYVENNGSYPKSIGLVMWATDVIKTGGDDVAYVLWLLGVKPKWSGYGGRVVGLEVIPLSELGRPRIDVVIRISGLFRDMFPDVVSMMDEAVRIVSELDESDEENYLLSNLRKDVVEEIANGMPPLEAKEDSLARIFGDAPGTYGSGTDILIKSSEWEDLSDLGEIYCRYGEYAYGKGRKGEKKSNAFRRVLKRIDATVKNTPSREYDILDIDDVYSDLGGMNAAVRLLSGRIPKSIIGCSANPSNIKTKTVAEEGRYIYRSKVMNPKWVDGLKEHGFRGAKELSDMTEYLFAWGATSQSTDQWMFDDVAKRFLFDDVNSQWLKEENPYAMMDMTSRLLEAIERGIWDANPEMRDKLESLYVELEGSIESLEDR